MPDLESDNPILVQYYHRSLMHLLMNEWNVPEFLLHPYYGTGSIQGDTICCYIWNYGGPARLWSMLNSTSAREHLETILNLDLNACYAFHADDGTGFGPYYPINQEKTIFLAYAYVMQTKDKGFLNKELMGCTVLDKLIELALSHDDLSKNAVLVDYGAGNHHLELRGANFASDPLMRYDGIIPDMNLRRCVGYHLVDELCNIAGIRPKVDLLARAAALKRLVHQELFSSKDGWFYGIATDGRKYLRYTIQIFKALGWGDWALEPEAERAIIKHLMDEDEFLGKFGLHSLSKIDPAYDETDVDNGGPGACVSFTPAIISRLYRSNHVNEAEKILERLLWMADALPFWGDSQRADAMEYRRCTDLQCDIESAVPAQTLIFGMFGITINNDFSIRIQPHIPPFANYIRLRNIRLAGKVFDIESERGKGTTVRIASRALHIQDDESICINDILP